MNSPKKAELSKAVLNVTTYKDDSDGKLPPVEKYEAIDITDLLKEHGITAACSVHGVCSVGGPYLPGDDDDEFAYEYAVTEEELLALCRHVSDILDIAIVNEKQNKALKKLIEGKFKDFINDHWEPIYECAFTKECVDKVLDKELNK